MTTSTLALESRNQNPVSQTLEALERIDQQVTRGEAWSQSEVRAAIASFTQAWHRVTQIENKADADAVDAILMEGYARGWLERIARTLLALRLNRLAPLSPRSQAAYQALRGYDGRWTSDVAYLKGCLAQDLLVEIGSPPALKRCFFNALVELVERLTPLPGAFDHDAAQDLESVRQTPGPLWVILDQRRRRYQGLLDPRISADSPERKIAQDPNWAAALMAMESPLGDVLLDDWQWFREHRRANRWWRWLAPWTTRRGRSLLWEQPGVLLALCAISLIAFVASLAAWGWLLKTNF